MLIIEGLKPGDIIAKNVDTVRPKIRCTQYKHIKSLKYNLFLQFYQIVVNCKCIAIIIIK